MSQQRQRNAELKELQLELTKKIEEAMKDWTDAMANVVKEQKLTAEDLRSELLIPHITLVNTADRHLDILKNSGITLDYPAVRQYLGEYIIKGAAQMTGEQNN